MWNKLRERLETILEPSIDSYQFVSHYVPALEYKRTDLPVKYAFNIEEYTQLNTYNVKNTYTQDLDAHVLFKSNKGYTFNIETSNHKFILDKSLVQQGKLLEDLSTLTEKLEVKISEKGIITSIEHKEVVKRWEKLKPALLERYQSNQAHAYIKGLGEKIADEDLLLEDVKQVRLLGLLFGGYQSAHEKDTPRNWKISHFINCLPIHFREKITETKEDESNKEKQISISGSMLPISMEDKERIKRYFSYYKAGGASLYLSNYKREVVLNLKTGFPKAVRLDIELTNGMGYLRQQQYTLTQIRNG